MYFRRSFSVFKPFLAVVFDAEPLHVLKNILKI